MISLKRYLSQLSEADRVRLLLFYSFSEPQDLLELVEIHVPGPATLRVVQPPVFHFYHCGVALGGAKYVNHSLWESYFAYANTQGLLLFKGSVFQW